MEVFLQMLQRLHCWEHRRLWQPSSQQLRDGRNRLHTNWWLHALVILLALKLKLTQLALALRDLQLHFRHLNLLLEVSIQDTHSEKLGARVHLVT